MRAEVERWERTAAEIRERLRLLREVNEDDYQVKKTRAELAAKLAACNRRIFKLRQMRLL
jgi:copper oxidase (laccase) domain-containing protein